MPLPYGRNHLGSVSIDAPALIPYTEDALSSTVWVAYPKPCALATIAVQNKDVQTVYLHVYDGTALAAAYPIPAAGIVYERIDLRIEKYLGLLLSTSASSAVAPATAGVISIGVQEWASGNPL